MNKKEREGELWPISPVVLKSVFDGSRGGEERVYEGRVLLLHLLTHLLLLKKEREKRKGEKNIFTLQSYQENIYILLLLTCDCNASSSSEILVRSAVISEQRRPILMMKQDDMLDLHHLTQDEVLGVFPHEH